MASFLCLLPNGNALAFRAPRDITGQEIEAQ